MSSTTERTGFACPTCAGVLYLTKHYGAEAKRKPSRTELSCRKCGPVAAKTQAVEKVK